MNDHDEDGSIQGGDARPRKGGAFGNFGLDLMKKAAFTAIGAAFMTEDAVRGYVAESKLPRDVAKYVIQNASQAKEQFFDYLAKEITTLVKKSDLPAVAVKFLREHTIELEAKIRFKPSGAPEVQLGALKAQAQGASAAGNGGGDGGGAAAAPTPTPTPGASADLASA